MGNKGGAADEKHHASRNDRTAFEWFRLHWMTVLEKGLMQEFRISLEYDLEDT